MFFKAAGLFSVEMQKMVRKLKSPVLAEHVKGGVYRLFFRTWQISGDGTCHSPVEEVLGTYTKVKSRERCDEKITTYDLVNGPKTHKFKKIN